MRYYLRKIREERGLTQAEIAKKVGIARITYTNIELGTKNPSFNVAVKIKQILHTNDDSIFLDSDVPVCNTDNEQSA